MIRDGIVLPESKDAMQQKYPVSDEVAQLNNHGHELAQLNMTAASVVTFRRAVAMAPDNPLILSSLGAVLFDAGEYAEAEAVLRRTVKLEPEYAPGLGNLGSVLGAQQRYDEALIYHRRALKADPSRPDVPWNFSMCLLDGGHWEEGFEHYESRYEHRGTQLYPKLPYPTWNGEDDLNGKTIYIQGEQGIGDRILFSRYLSWLHDKYPAARILFMHNAEDLPNISNLLWEFRHFVEFLPVAIPWPDDVDYGIYLMSLARIHGSTPDNVPPDPGLILKNARRHQKSVQIPEPHHPALKVGIVWTGNTKMKRNAERSIPLESLLTLAELPNVVLYSLQFGSNDIDRLCAGQLICDLRNDIAPFGFAGTAAAMLNLDLVITSCTATAHLAGALGVPCWTLLCANPYWVWLRGRSDSPWYPGMRLFRQKRQNDWAPVLQQVRPELQALAEAHTEVPSRKAA